MGCPSWILAEKCDPGKYSQNPNKFRLRFLPLRRFPFWLLWPTLWHRIPPLRGKNAILTSTCKIQIKVVYVFFTHRAFSMFTTFGYPLGCHPGSLLQKCAPDKYSQNLNKSRLCFLTHQAFFIVVPLAVPWGPILDPCSKSMTLTSVATIQIRIVSVFLAIKHFPFSLLGLSLGMPSWILAAKV